MKGCIHLISVPRKNAAILLRSGNIRIEYSQPVHEQFL